MRIFNHDTHDNCTDTTHDLGTQNGGDTILFGDGLHAGHVGKADAQDDRKARAQAQPAFFSQRKQLEQGGKGGYDKRSLDQDHPVCGIDTGRAGNDDSGRHAAHNHGDYVLERQGNRLAHFWNAVQIEQ